MLSHEPEHCPGKCCTMGMHFASGGMALQAREPGTTTRTNRKPRATPGKPHVAAAQREPAPSHSKRGPQITT